MPRMDDAYASSAYEEAVDFDVRGRATTAHTLGVISLVLSLLGYCSAYTTFLFALPMALITIHYARTVLAQDPDEVSEVYARNAMTIGVISAIYSALFILFIGMIILLYVGIFGVAILANL